jgi:hypothetical protein
MPRGDGVNARTRSLDGWSITLAAGQDTTPTTRTTELTPGHRNLICPSLCRVPDLCRSRESAKAVDR